MNKKNAAIVDAEIAEVAESQYADKTQYIINVMEARIEKIQAVKKPYVDEVTGEINKIMRAESKRADKLIEQMKTSIRVAKALDGKDYTLNFGARKCNFFGYFRAVVDAGYRRTHSVKYYKGYFGSLRWILQRANAAETEDTQPIRTLQAKIKRTQAYIARKKSGFFVVGWYTKNI